MYPVVLHIVKMTHTLAITLYNCLPGHPYLILSRPDLLLTFIVFMDSVRNSSTLGVRVPEFGSVSEISRIWIQSKFDVTMVVRHCGADVVAAALTM